VGKGISSFEQKNNSTKITHTAYFENLFLFEIFKNTYFIFLYKRGQKSRVVLVMEVFKK
jgi:hypothetical protein